MLLLNSTSTSAADIESTVRAAQQGDPRAFAALFARHYPGMLAVAHQILGSASDAEDACQDAAITAFGRIGDLRDPSAVRSWLHAIVRNNCRTVLRARKPIPVGVAGENLPASELDDPVACVERSALRDWIWHGLRQLSPAAQTVALLRYFTENNSYDQIAALCGIPVGTVRSRLSEARRQLAAVLPGVHDDKHDDGAALIAERREEATAILNAIPDGRRPRRLLGRWDDDMTMVWPCNVRSDGVNSVVEALQKDYDNGVGLRLTGLVAGAGITIWENAFLNPPDDPERCPPAATWLLRERKGRVHEVRLIRVPR